MDRQVPLGPWITLDAVDDRGQPYAVGFRGGSGGGRRDGGEDHRFFFRFAPALDPAAGGVTVSARLRLHRSGDGSPSEPVVTWEDSEPWVFAVTLVADVATSSAGPIAARPLSAECHAGEPPGLARLVRVVPVVAERAVAGWTVTFVAAEIHAGGVRLDYRVRGPADVGGDPQLGVRVTDDRGDSYRVWDGGGTGIADADACHWRLSSVLGPAPAGDVRALRTEVEEIRFRTLEPDPHQAGVHRLLVAGRIPFAWDRVVGLS